MHGLTYPRLTVHKFNVSFALVTQYLSQMFKNIEILTSGLVHIFEKITIYFKIEIFLCSLEILFTIFLCHVVMRDKIIIFVMFYNAEK